ncbi:putative involucrin repeat protein [Eutypa lata UCREL1]|uniref:Putative involucrin repeat protein n=1 Tax=Eutypa lata (strain UCR-EL1) TaxID=1287681 RepID=M7SNW5_EUTLA|nr:putative involucrin repeat protein [Eutypa lata UCREL1]
MNGYAHRGQNSFDAGIPQALRPSPTPSRPSTRGLYSHDSSNSFGQDNTRFAQPPLVDLKDSVQVHLLTETAILDSKEFQILAQEEVDALKKRCQALNQRIEQTRSNLAIQSKYRDAAISMSKLYSTGKSDGARRSLLGGRSHSDSDAAREAEAEREATQKKCDDLAAELRAPPSGQLEPGDMIGSHLDYLENGLYTLGLWGVIQSGYANIRQQKLERRKARLDKGMEVDEDDVSEGESFDAEEPYSLTAFAARVQWLYGQATGLQEQKGVLKRQIKQQRELNSRSDSEKDEAYRAKVEELEQTQVSLMNTERETDMIRAELSQALEDLNNMQRNHSEEAGIIDEAQAALRERNQKIAALEANLREVQPRLAAADANIEAITAQLQEVNAAKEAAEQAAEEKQAEAASRQKDIETKQGELTEVTNMVAELKMEAALAKAELDGAYGSRKERAAEAAALYDSGEGAKMKNRIDALEKELRGTAKDLTDVVQQSLEYEKKIRGLEAELDKVTAERARLRDERERNGAELERATREAATDVEERLGAEIARLRRDRETLQDELDNERLKSGNAMPLSPGGAPRTSYLTEQYRTGLRAERKKYEEQLRAEHMARRKVEDELRAMKRAQGGGGGAGAGAGSGPGAVAPLRSPSALSPPPPR